MPLSPGQVAFQLTGDEPSMRLVCLTSERKTFERDGQQWLTVRNPWGFQPPVNTPRGLITTDPDGAITLTAEEFKAGFPAAFIAD